MSFGGGYNSALHTALEDLINNYNVVAVAAIGNSQSQACSGPSRVSPASSSSVLAVCISVSICVRHYHLLNRRIRCVQSVLKVDDECAYACPCPCVVRLTLLPCY
jgi:hypothetical protein